MARPTITHKLEEAAKIAAQIAAYKGRIVQAQAGVTAIDYGDSPIKPSKKQTRARQC